jgi:hypothetical protein
MSESMEAVTWGIGSQERSFQVFDVHEMASIVKKIHLSEKTCLRTSVG